MDIHEELTNWAMSSGVELSGIALHAFPGRGVGAIAQKNLEVCHLHSPCLPAALFNRPDIITLLDCPNKVQARWVYRRVRPEGKTRLHNATQSSQCDLPPAIPDIWAAEASIKNPYRTNQYEKTGQTASLIFPGVGASQGWEPAAPG